MSCEHVRELLEAYALGHPRSGREGARRVAPLLLRSPGILGVNAKGFGLLVFGSARAGPSYDGVRIVLEHAGARPGAVETVLTWTGKRS